MEWTLGVYIAGIVFRELLSQIHKYQVLNLYERFSNVFTDIVIFKMDKIYSFLKRKINKFT